MTEEQIMLAEAVGRLFADHVTPEKIAAAEEGEWLGDLWDAVERSGLTRPFDGGSWVEACIIAKAVGRHAVPLPVVETILGAWLLDQAGVEVPSGSIAVASTELSNDALSGDRLRASLSRVPWARHVAHVVAVVPGEGDVTIACAPTPTPTRLGANLAREPRDDMEVDSTAATGRATLPTNVVTLYGALLRSAAMAGALESILDRSVQYANERIQFGRPIGKLQIVQQELARLAGMTAAAGMAAALAAGAATTEGEPSLEIANAKVVVGDAADAGPRIAHQVHGAIGFTYEHALHFFTRRLLSWRGEYGSTEYWAREVGDVILCGAPAHVWPTVTSR